MFSLFSIVMLIQVISALAIIVLVLLQQGKGADMGSAFGSGSAGSLFGASGAANFLSRMTKWAAVVFFVTTGTLAWLGHQAPGSGTGDPGLMEGYKAPQNLSVPQAPGAVAPAGNSVPGTAPAANGSVPGATAPDASVPAAPQTPPASTPATPAAPAQQQ